MLFKLPRMKGVAIVAGLLGVAYYLILYPFVVHRTVVSSYRVSNTLPGGEAAGKRRSETVGRMLALDLELTWKLRFRIIL